MIRTYADMLRYTSFDDRFEYLKLGGEVGRSTFGHDRYLNQRFYRSSEWKNLRSYILVRDEGCDLADPEHPIADRPIVHHMNPLMPDDIIQSSDNLMNPEYLITVSHNTHNAIHYGDASLLPTPLVDRSPGDTKLW